mgnify:CR=1 FL=1
MVLKKKIQVNIFQNSISVIDNYVHVYDKNVVELAGEFKHNFFENLENVKMDVISHRNGATSIATTSIVDNKFSILLHNSLFEKKGTFTNQIKLYLSEETLYINDAFQIHVVDCIEYPDNFKETFAIAVEKIENAIRERIRDSEDIIDEEVKKVIPSIAEEQVDKVVKEKVREIKEEKAKTPFHLEMTANGDLYFVLDE